MSSNKDYKVPYSNGEYVIIDIDTFHIKEYSSDKALVEFANDQSDELNSAHKDFVAELDRVHKVKATLAEVKHDNHLMTICLLAMMALNAVIVLFK